jgi:hypothetical protein
VKIFGAGAVLCCPLVMMIGDGLMMEWEYAEVWQKQVVNRQSSSNSAEV